MTHQEMNLNIRYDAPNDIWEKVPLIYRQLEGWLGDENVLDKPGIPYWFSFDENEKHICASLELGCSGYGNDYIAQARAIGVILILNSSCYVQ